MCWLRSTVLTAVGLTRRPLAATGRFLWPTEAVVGMLLAMPVVTGTDEAVLGRTPSLSWSG